MSDLALDEIERPDIQPSAMKPDQLLPLMKGWYNRADSHSDAWRQGVAPDFDFTVGKQYTDTELADLEEMGIPPVVMNRVGTIINAVSGLEQNNRHDVQFMPYGTEPGEVVANEVLTAASRWMGQKARADDKQSMAFRHAIICGMGWIETRVDFDSDPRGVYVESVVDPREMRWDANAREPNLTDAKHLFRTRRLTLSEAAGMFPGVALTDLHAEWADTGFAASAPHVHPAREFNFVAGRYHDPAARITVVQAQWIEHEPIYRVGEEAVTEDGEGEVYELTAAEFRAYKKAAKEQGVKFEAVKARRKVWRQCFIGRDILTKPREPQTGARFSFHCITGESDYTAGTWHGLVRVMRDPQKYANAWLAQTVAMLNKTAKGGIIAEDTAFTNPAEAEESYASPDAITWAAEGAIREGRIMSKPGSADPSRYMALIDYAVRAIPDGTGINLELLGLRDVNQPGILEAHRKQSAMTILAPLMNSLRGFRISLGAARLHLIQTVFADGRLVQITDGKASKVMRLLKSEVLGDFDVIVEDAPTSASMRQDSWEAIRAILPQAQSFLTPDVLVDLLEYSPIPSELIALLRKRIEEASADPMADQMRQLQARAVLARIAKDEAATEKTRADARSALAEIDAIAARSLRDRAAAAVSIAEAHSMYMDNKAAAAFGQWIETANRRRGAQALDASLFRALALAPEPQNDGQPPAPRAPAFPPQARFPLNETVPSPLAAMETDTE